MFLFKDISKSKYFPVRLLALLTGFNFLVSYLFKTYHWEYVRNISPFVFGKPGLILTFGLLLFIVVKDSVIKLARSNTVPACFLVSGVVSNMLEFTFSKFVVDYINIGIAFVNIADIEIYVSIIYLNYVWFFKGGHNTK